MRYFSGKLKHCSMTRWPLLLLVASLAFTSLSAQQITLSDIFEKGTFRQQYVWGIQHLPDGEHYTTVGNGAILKHAYATGAVVDTLFHTRWAGTTLQGRQVSLHSYTLGPDGNKMLIPVEQEGIYRYSSKSHFYIYHRDSKKLEKLTEGGKQMYATFSPDGQKVAWVQDNNLFFKDLAKGKQTQITRDGRWNYVINGASDWVYEEELKLTRAFEWSPDSRMIAFLRFDEGRVRQFNMTMYGTGLYPEDYTFKYPKAGEDNAIVSVHVYQTDRKRMRDLRLNTGNNQYFPRIQWAPGADNLIVWRMNRHQNKLELLQIEVMRNRQRTLYTEENPYYIDANDRFVLFLKNGEQFICSSEKDGYHHLYLFDMRGREQQQLTKGKWDVTAIYGVDEEAGYVYYQSVQADPLERHVYRAKLDGSAPEQISQGPGWHDYDYAPGFRYVIRTYSSHKTPPLYSLHTGTGQLVRTLEDNSKLANTAREYGMRNKEFFSLKNRHGDDLNAWMIKPAGFDAAKEYPVLMFVYGGPGYQTVENKWGGRNDLWFQYLAQQGYVVMSVDSRGAGGQGQEFQKKHTYMNLGLPEAEDQIDAGKWIASQAWADSARIGIFGWSYGGTMSSLCLFLAPEVFRMAIAVAPVSHWKFYDTIYTERYMRTPKENPEGYESGSPINYVKGLRGKYLLVHGTGDDNVHVQNTMVLSNALVEAGKPFHQFLYPDRAHGMSGRGAHMHLYSMMTEFVKENL